MAIKKKRKGRKEIVSKRISLNPIQQATTIASLINEQIDDTVYFHMDKISHKVGEVLTQLVRSNSEALHRIKTLPTNLYMMDERRTAKFLNITVTELREWTTQGLIYPITIGTKLYYRPEDLISGKKPFE